MADTISKAQRSAVMAAVRSTQNRSTELRLAALLRAIGVTGWRRGFPLTGRPDFVFPKLRIAVFVDGCFWHRCPLHCRPPSSNQGYWVTKLGRNQTRDRAISRALRSSGWKVLRIWEHELRRKALPKLTRRILRSFRPPPPSSRPRIPRSRLPLPPAQRN
ncbi:MAG TPA: very short patch repair endonuclease [Opitutaceae bacterium]|nr:very short patch repair endonuclease [Opitutaceae bacterium]